MTDVSSPAEAAPGTPAAETARLRAALAACEIIDVREPDDRPLVSTIVSLYQAEEFVYQCLGDLVGQTLFERSEIIVVDAASPQRERLITAHFQKKRGRIVYCRTPSRIGIYPAWNLGVLLARGEYLTTFSSNDRLLPDAHEALAGELAADPEAALVYGDSYISYDPRADLAALLRKSYMDLFKWPPYSYEDLLATNRVGPHPMWRRSVHAEAGFFDESLVALGDQEFWLRMGRRWPLKHIERFTGIYYRTKGALSAGDVADREFDLVRKRYRALYARDKRAAEAWAGQVRALLAAGEVERGRALLAEGRRNWPHVDVWRDAAAMDEPPVEKS